MLDSNADALNGEKQGSDFCDVSRAMYLCARGHENWRKLKHLIFMKFRAPGVMKVGEN